LNLNRLWAHYSCSEVEFEYFWRLGEVKEVLHAHVGADLHKLMVMELWRCNWSHLEVLQTIWSELELIWTIWRQIEQFGGVLRRVEDIGAL